ncbi:helix-turn-helix domain-containing protein [Desulfitobacterium sp. PCE1]|uniref:helix-turn-helix domain-containing protein n=1 Tax=Desulfitobacterium sp. PCE1 TaxID=146907 RepID=UPI0003A06655|nr:helix-turn-helix transcriptional regulator [Desulfitobacterium sp. PCE1]
MDIKILFGKTVREYRLKRNLSQEKLAELCELHRTYISDVERGDRNVSLENIYKICSALGVSVSKVFKDMGV